MKLEQFIDEGLNEWSTIKENDFEEFLARLVLATIKNPNQFTEEANNILNTPKRTIEYEVNEALKWNSPLDAEKIKIICANLIIESIYTSDIIEEAKEILKNE